MSRKFIAILTASVASLSINCGEIGASSGPNVDAQVSGHQWVNEKVGREKTMKGEWMKLDVVEGDDEGKLLGEFLDVPRVVILPPQQLMSAQPNVIQIRNDGMP